MRFEPGSRAVAVLAGLTLFCAVPAWAAKAAPQAPTVDRIESDPDGTDPATQKRLGYIAQSAGRYETAWKLLLPIAERGDAEAEYQVAWLNEIGWEGFPGDLQQATAWYRRSATHGNTLAQLWLGYKLAGRMAVDARGFRDPADIFEGVKWLQLAGNSGNQEAQLMLGDIYSSGLGPVQKDLEEARRWLGKAADQGNNLAKIMLRTAPLSAP